MFDCKALEGVIAPECTTMLMLIISPDIEVLLFCTFILTIVHSVHYLCVCVTKWDGPLKKVGLAAPMIN